MSGLYQEGALAVSVTGGEAALEAMGSFATQAATGANVAAYQGIVGVAPRTLIRLCQFVSGISSVTPTFRLFRTIAGQVAIAQQCASINVSIGAVQAICIGNSTDAALVGAQVTVLQQQTGALANGSGQALVTNAQFPLYLFPGDALVVSGVDTAAAAQMKSWWAFGEYVA